MRKKAIRKKVLWYFAWRMRIVNYMNKWINERINVTFKLPIIINLCIKSSKS